MILKLFYIYIGFVIGRYTEFNLDLETFMKYIEPIIKRR